MKTFFILIYMVGATTGSRHGLLKFDTELECKSALAAIVVGVGANRLRKFVKAVSL